LLTVRNKAYSHWLKTSAQRDLVRFQHLRREVRQAVKRAKSTWSHTKAEEIEKDRFGGKQVWQCIRDMQCGRRGLLPLKVVTICDEEGLLA